MNDPRIGNTPPGSAWESPLIPWSSARSDPKYVGEQRDKHGVGNLVIQDRANGSGKTWTSEYAF